MNRSSSTTISAELGLKLVVPQQTIVPLVASMYYSGSDPYAVRMAFHVGTDEPVEWIFARDLLAAGTITPVIDRCYGLAEVSTAMRYQQGRHARGKVVISLGNTAASLTA